MYDYLRARYGGLDQTFPGLETIAKALKISRSTVERALEGLKKEGAIEVRPRWKENGARTTNEYVTMWRPPEAR
ncbi:GntR family transcriptional regulator [Streptomyces sp. NPDC048516]|uniref:GntR family transcriptional regulator n=1 Tax=Streptomyces sp. NPDC048516 TaxID=3365565 RepID=UPI003715245B